MYNLSYARSFLFVPGDRPERFAKAIATCAHAVIIDLEDAVAPEDKDEARSYIASFLDSVRQEKILLRINDADSPYFDGDLEIARHPKLSGVILPKANKFYTSTLIHKLEKPIWPLIETAQGLADLNHIAQLPNLARLLLGTIDLSLDMGLNMNHPAGKTMLDQARFALVFASKLATLPPPVDGVFVNIEDKKGLRNAADHARAAGMSGMMCIHPSQVDVVHEAFSPNDSELEWASAVITAAASEKNSFRFRGQMVDKPVLERARKILSSGKTA